MAKEVDAVRLILKTVLTHPGGERSTVFGRGRPLSQVLRLPSVPAPHLRETRVLLPCSARDGNSGRKCLSPAPRQCLSPAPRRGCAAAAAGPPALAPLARSVTPYCR